MQFLNTRKHEKIQEDIDILMDAWICIEKKRAELPKRMTHDASVNFTKSKKDLVVPDRLIIRLSHDLVRKMGWRDGDFIFAYTHPDNVFLVKLCRSNGRNGWKLSQNKKKPLGPFNLQIKWHNPNGIQLDNTPAHPVNHQIYKECIIMDIMKDAIE